MKNNIFEITYKISNIEEVASQVLPYLSSKIIRFNGEMGVGKTTFIKALTQALGSNDTVVSPTYNLVNEYELHNDKIFHFDLYRVKDEEELYDIGIEDYLSSTHWIFIEWANKFENILPKLTHTIEILLNPNGTRTLTLKVCV